MKRGGHDPEKVYAAYKAAVEYKGAPTVSSWPIPSKVMVWANPVKARILPINKKSLMNRNSKNFRTRFNIPISDAEVAKAPFYKPAEDSPEMQYLRQRRNALGGALPMRRTKTPVLKTPSEEIFEEFYKGTEGRPVSTTMAYVRVLSKLLRDEIHRQIYCSHHSRRSTHLWHGRPFPSMRDLFPRRPAL